MKVDLNSPVYVIVFTVIVSAAFTAAVTTLQVVGEDKIRRNEALRAEKAIVEVFHLGNTELMTAEEIAELVGRRVDRRWMALDPETGRKFDLVRAYKTDAEPGSERNDADLVGVAFEISGNGFWAPISGLMALSPDLGRVLGVAFLDHSETPGLGGRITEEQFQKQFEGLNVAPPAAGRKFIYIAGERPERPDDPRFGRSVDAITGATQTSAAVERFINENLAQFRRAMRAGPRRKTND
ncbi:MAG: FMN-binding protein [Phycisphaerae bacterium]|nr:FMN-binding protein [Phycisphaerae bacterium]